MFGYIFNLSKAHHQFIAIFCELSIIVNMSNCICINITSVKYTALFIYYVVNFTCMCFVC